MAGGRGRQVRRHDGRLVGRVAPAGAGANHFAKVPDDIGFVNDIVKEIPPQFRMTPEEKAEYLRDKARMKEEDDEYRRAHAGDTPGVGVPRWDNEATREVEAEPEKDTFTGL